MGMLHWHVIKSLPGYLPESDPYVTEDALSALDALAHELHDYADSETPDLTDDEANEAEARYEQLCTCREGERSAEHRDALATVNDGRGLCEYFGRLVFEMNPCREKDCLKYCPNAECRTVTAIDDCDRKCWTCGATYVAWDACEWLEPVSA